MKHTTIILLLLLNTFTGSFPLWAAGPDSNDGSENKLPKPGTWARYQGVTRKDGGPEPPAFQAINRTLNSTTVNDVPCRWFEQEGSSETDNWHTRRKFLIPEKSFASSERPFDDLVRYLQRDSSDALSAANVEDEGWMPHEFLFFPGFLKNAKLVDAPRTVNYQRGSLFIAKAYEGSYKWQKKGRDPEKTVLHETTFQVWLHPDVPAGFAHAKTRYSVKLAEKELRYYDIEYHLQDFGDDAKPAIVEEHAP